MTDCIPMIAGTRSIPPGGNSLSVVQSGRMTSRAEHLRASTPESWKWFSLARGSWRTSRSPSTPGSRHYRHGYFDPDPTTLGGRFSRVDSWVRARRQGCLARAKRSSRDRFVETRRSLQVREPPPHAVDPPEWRIANPAAAARGGDHTTSGSHNRSASAEVSWQV